MNEVLIWSVIGWGIGVGAVLALMLVVRGDLTRLGTRRQRRCPKCWYDLSHSLGMTCSECGFTATSERQLRKPRWRRHYALAALLLWTGSHFAFHVPAMNQRGWVAAVPTTLLVGWHHKLEPMTYWDTIPNSMSGTNSVALTKRLGGELLIHRLQKDDTWNWQRIWLVRRAVERVDWNRVSHDDDRSRRGNEQQDNINAAILIECIRRAHDINLDSLLQPLRDQSAHDLIAFSESENWQTNDRTARVDLDARRKTAEHGTANRDKRQRQRVAVLLHRRAVTGVHSMGRVRPSH